MADDAVEPAVAVVQEEVTEKVAAVQTKWERVKGWFKDSLTIFWARIQYVVGVVGAGLIATFSGYDFTQLASMDIKDVFKLLGMLVITGVLTELARRRTL